MCEVIFVQKEEREYIPKFRGLFGHLKNEAYVTPEGNIWRHDNSDFDPENDTKRMKDFKPMGE